MCNCCGQQREQVSRKIASGQSQNRTFDLKNGARGANRTVDSVTEDVNDNRVKTLPIADTVKLERQRRF